jgi:hypothetical protein
MTGFYWLYARHLEAKRFNSEFSRFFNTELSSRLALLDPEEKTALSALVNSSAIDKLKDRYANSADPRRSRDNLKVLALNMSLLAGLLALFIVVVRAHKLSWRTVGYWIGLSILVDVFIVIAEYLIFTKVVLHYSPVLPSELAQVMVHTAKERLGGGAKHE